MKNGNNGHFIYGSNDSVRNGFGGVYFNGIARIKRNPDLEKAGRVRYEDSGRDSYFAKNRATFKGKGFLSMKTILIWLRIRRIWLFTCLSLWTVSFVCYLSIKSPKQPVFGVSDMIEHIEQHKQIKPLKASTYETEKEREYRNNILE
jgi:hypothetical protein